MGTMSSLTLIELQRARAFACDTRRRWLITDPLGYPEIRAADLLHLGDEPHVVEAEFLRRPKQSGGVRVEVLPDVLTSTYLQAVANRLCEHDLGLDNSLSAPLFRLHRRGENPYDVWVSEVPQWVVGALDAGYAVVVADIRDFFRSVTRDQIRQVLERPFLEKSLSHKAIGLIDQINAVPCPNGSTRSGIPVAPDDFFWLLGDLVLSPVDTALRGCRSVLAHARWVDDWYIATSPRTIDHAIGVLETVLNDHGFQLNQSKTRVIGSIEQFETMTLAREHSIVSDLFLASSKGAMSARQVASLEALIQQAPETLGEAARLWKRLYALARRLKSPLLLDRALADLDRLPMAQLPIFSYVGSFGWQHCPVDHLSVLLSPDAPDPRSLGILRMLLTSPTKLPPELCRLLDELIRTPADGLHPFCRILAYANLLKAGAAENADALLQALGDLPSAVARRVGLEFLWLQPSLHPVLRGMIAADPSPIVRSLALIAERSIPSQTSVRLASDTAWSLKNWGGLDQRAATAFGLTKGPLE
ncbi:MAG: RNA-directed DNA polymerase [Methanobacterium sp.]|nr:RNA-directed DNA polymerase [Methanobacterium sp.]